MTAIDFALLNDINAESPYAYYFGDYGNVPLPENAEIYNEVHRLYDIGLVSCPVSHSPFYKKVITTEAGRKALASYNLQLDQIYERMVT